MKAALATASPKLKSQLLQKVWARADTAKTGALGREQVQAVLLQMGRDEAFDAANATYHHECRYIW